MIIQISNTEQKTTIKQQQTQRKAADPEINYFPPQTLPLSRQDKLYIYKSNFKLHIRNILVMTSVTHTKNGITVLFVLRSHERERENTKYSPSKLVLS
jgi:hypothetical protein